MGKENFLEKVSKEGFDAIIEKGVVKVLIKSGLEISDTKEKILKLVKENKYDKSFGITVKTI